MSAVVNVALPVFALILAGWAAGRGGILGLTASEALNKFVYWFALPALLFGAMARTPLDEIIRLDFIAAFLISTLSVMALAGVLGMAIHRTSPAEATMQGMNAGFSNTGYMGIPLFAAAFGAPGVAAASLATVLVSTVIISVVVLILELLGVPAAGRPARRSDSRAGRMAGALAALAVNPLVLAPLLGLAWSMSGWPVPAPLGRFVDLLGAAAGPCALFAIGLFLAGQRLRANLAEVGWISVIKLIAHPVIIWLLVTFVFTMEPFWQMAAIMLAALPTGALTFVVAQRYQVYVERSSGVIFVSTIISVVTLSVLLALYAPRFGVS